MTATDEHTADTSRLRRAVAAGMTALGTPVGLTMLHPLLAVIVVVAEVLIILTIASTALFGSPELSDRAFRLLRWIGGRPEPPAPEQPQAPNPVGFQKACPAPELQ
ncbi:MAG: hypothetical protein ACLPKI_27760 [Streptosporangiaceae bacterium]